MPREWVTCLPSVLDLQMGATPLHYAARGGLTEVVRAMLACPRVNAQAGVSASTVKR